MASSVEGQLISCHTLDQWKEYLEIGLQSKKLVVVDFTASWCAPCRFITPILVEIAKKTPNGLFLKVDVDELKSLAEDYKVDAMPTFMFLKEGKEVDRVVGASKDVLMGTVAKWGDITA